MINSNRKGKAGEREFRDVLRAAGFAAERGVQYKGTPGSPDVICGELPIHFEVKFGKRLLLREAYVQAVAECGKLVPVVAHRFTRRGKTEPWMITLSAEDFLKIIKNDRQEKTAGGSFNGLA